MCRHFSRNGNEAPPATMIMIDADDADDADDDGDIVAPATAAACDPSNNKELVQARQDTTLKMLYINSTANKRSIAYKQPRIHRARKRTTKGQAISINQ
jgi:hypothetical protein